MKLPQFSIAGLMGLVVIAALGFTGLRTPSPTWAGAAFSLILWTMLLALWAKSIVEEADNAPGQDPLPSREDAARWPSPRMNPDGPTCRSER